ncbi:MAG: hypothetical protein OSJ66_07475 [Clostridia bacterium]|nr:hypothetical protein [Clostridia bacterium]
MKKHTDQQNGTKFVIRERGKKRNITTNIMVDKTVNHLLCDEVLSPAISPFLIHDNGASQKSKGVAFSRKRLETHLHRYYREHESKEFLNEVLVGVLKIADKLELVINPKKTYIVKLSQTFKFLQLKYSLTETGRIIKRINPKAITRQRRKLKAYKRLLDNNRLTYNEIENIFKGWIAANYKNMSMQQITNMSQLYYNLFGRKVTWKNHGKLRYLMEHNLKTLD